MKPETQRSNERKQPDSITVMRREAEAALLPGAGITIKRGRGWSRLNRKVTPCK